MENAIGILEKGFFHDLEERRYFSLEQFNTDLWEKLDELNDAPFKKKEHCRSYYWKEEKEELMPLPSMQYQYMERSTAKVSSDFHVRFDNAYYSVDNRDYIDYSFDWLKKIYNSLIWKLKLPQKRLLNTLKYWRVMDEESNRRAGLPILTTKRKTWVDASDVHSGVVGSTNSGKTYSVYHHMIELSRMAKESMFINDIKGDLAEKHRWQLEQDGYDILRIDFIHPELSVRWNPFGKVVRSYREAQDRVRTAVTNEDEWEHYIDLKKDLIRSQSRIMDLYRKKDQETDTRQQTRLEQMIRTAEKNSSEFKRRILQCEQGFINTYGDDAKIRFGDTFEQLATICKAICEEKNAKQPHFWQMAQALMEGIICFLLEYEYIDDHGNLCRLDEKQINFKNLKQVKIEGFNNYQISGKSHTIIGYYLKNFRKTTDKSVEKLSAILATCSEERGSIFTTFDNKISLGTIDDRICDMMCETSFDWNDIIRKPTVIFMVVHSEKNLYYPFVTLFFNQLYEENAAEYGRIAAVNTDTIAWIKTLDFLFK